MLRLLATSACLARHLGVDLSRSKSKRSRKTAPEAAAPATPSEEPEKPVAPAAVSSTRSRPRPRLWPLIPVLAIHVGFLAVILSMTKSAVPAAWLNPLDRVVTPGAASAVSARLESDDPLISSRGIAGVELEFAHVLSDGSRTPLGRAITDADGVASVAWNAPSEPGRYSFTVALVDPNTARVDRPSGRVLVTVLAPETRVVLVSLRHTVRQPQLDDHGHTAVALRDGAKEVLSDLASSGVQIGYVASDGRPLPGALLEFLKSAGLPEGPIWYCPRGRGGEPLAAALEEHDWQPWSDRWAVCASEREARALAAAGFETLYMTAGLPPPGAKSVAQWSDVREHLRRR